MREAPRREVHGIMKNGERVYLGNPRMTDENVEEFLGMITDMFKGDGGWFQVEKGIYDSSAFAGVQVAP